MLCKYIRKYKLTLHILNFKTKCRWVVSYRHQKIYTKLKCPWYLTYMRLAQSPAALSTVEKISVASAGNQTSDYSHQNT
jgi:hypothetical protein